MTTPRLTEAQVAELQRLLEDDHQTGEIGSEEWDALGSWIHLHGPALLAERAELKAEVDRRQRFLEMRGYRPCDIPACNCDSWHGGDAERRLNEIYEALCERTDGSTALAAVKLLVEQVATLESRLTSLGVDSLAGQPRSGGGAGE